MKLAVSLLSFRPGCVGGAETYVRALLKEFPTAGARDDRFVVVLDRDLARALETPGWERAIVPRGARAVIGARILEAFTPYRALDVERAVNDVGADVVLYPQQSIFPKRVAGKAVMTVGDVQHLVMPENIPLFERLYRSAIYPYSLRRSDHLIAVSKFTRKMLVERCNVPAKSITVVPHGYEATGSTTVPTDRVTGRYIYYPAATFPHKGHAELIRSYAVLRRRGDVDARLVFTGMQTPLWRSLARLARACGVADDVLHLGFLPYPEVRRVFAGAEAVVFPSRYEGFGIPVLEAAVDFGKNVITSRLPVFEEIGVPSERQIDFADPDALATALALPAPTILAKAPSTWADCARRTMQLLRSVAAGARS